MAAHYGAGYGVNAFLVGDHYVFAHYFERRELFDKLETHYDREEYRFDVPCDDFVDVRDLLREEGVDLVPVEDLEPYCVVMERYEKHADVLRESVDSWRRRDHVFFLLRDEFAVEQALERGATPVADTEFALGV